MDKKQAIKIVRETFESPFDKGRFTNFIKNLLNEPDLTEGFAARSGKYIPDSFKGHIEKYERLGIYEDRDGKRIDLLIVHLKKESSIERARSMQRNFVAGYLQGRYGSDSGKDAALVAFVPPLTSSPPPSGSPKGVLREGEGREDWRFSLVRLEVRMEAGERGIKVKDEFTPAKRWSFLVGKNEKSHTAQTQFVPIMQDTENNPTLADLEEAFNIEKVTKEFFLKYRELFIRTKEELDRTLRKDARVREEFERKGIDTVNLAKKLLGQIVFLYYLQKKGWFGVPRDAAWGEGSRNFLRELFEKKHGGYQNFFNDILEPLFYEALRIDRSHDDHYYSRFDCKIPFLNGGLFDPMGNYDWVRTDILLPNDLFSNRNSSLRGRSPKQSPTDDEEIASLRALAMTDYDEGDGILDIFDRYNFTVKEDEPFEKEVAIDPELLGKAYEKFNAIRPDNYEEYRKALKSGKKGEESKFNKQYGVYYTPREIVHYMCQQSLINYLYSELNPNVVYQSLGNDQFDMFGNEGKGGQLDLSVEHRPMTEVPKEDIETLILRGEQIKEHDERVVNEGRETKDYRFQMPESIRRNASLIDGKLAAIKVCDPAVGSGAFPVGMMSEIVKARMALTTYTPLSSPLTPIRGQAGGDSKPFPLQGGQRGVSAYDFKRQCIENSLYGVDIDAGAVEIAKLRLWLSLVVDEDDPQNIKPLPNLDYKIVCGNSLLGLPYGVLLDSDVQANLEQRKKEYFYITNPIKKHKLREEIADLFSQLVDSARQFDSSLGDINFDFHVHFSEVFHDNEGFDVTIGNPPYVRADSGDEYLAFRRAVEKSGRYETLWEKWDLYVPFIEIGYKLLKANGTTTMIVSDAYCHAKYAQKSQTWFLKNSRILRLDFLNKLELFEAGVRNITYFYQKANGKENAPERRVHYPQFDSIINLPTDKQSNLTHRAFFPEDTKVQTFSTPTMRLDEICYISVGMVVHADEKVAKGAFQLEDLLSSRSK